MVLPENLSHDAIVAAIKSGNESLLERVELFDLFMVPAGGNLDARRKSLAYSLTYRDKNRTLTSKEVTAVHDRIKERLKRELGVELRE